MMFAELTWDPLMHETGIPLAIMGMVVVFAALGILVLIITALPRVIDWAESKTSRGDASVKQTPSVAQAATTTPAPTPAEANVSSSGTASGDASGDEAGLPPELVAVIAAAVEFELGPVHIVRMRPLTASELAWTLEGRLRHHASHRLQPRSR